MNALPLTASGMSEAFIYQKLSGDTLVGAVVGGRIFTSIAPEGALPPYIVFAWQGGVDTTALGPYRTLSRLRYAVKVIGKDGSIAALDTLMRRVDTLLFGASADYSQGRVLSCTRLQQMVLGDPDLGVQFRQLVNTYEIVVTEQP
jgi:hypothetical protein